MRRRRSAAAADYSYELAQLERERARAPLAREARDMAYELLNVTLDDEERFDIESLAYLLGEHARFGDEIPIEDAEQLLIGLRSLMPEAA